MFSRYFSDSSLLNNNECESWEIFASECHSFYEKNENIRLTRSSTVQAYCLSSMRIASICEWMKLKSVEWILVSFYVKKDLIIFVSINYSVSKIIRRLLCCRLEIPRSKALNARCIEYFYRTELTLELLQYCANNKRWILIQCGAMIYARIADETSTRNGELSATYNRHILIHNAFMLFPSKLQSYFSQLPK